MSEIEVVTDKRKEIETILRLDGYNEVVEFLDYCRHSKEEYIGNHFAGQCSPKLEDYHYYTRQGSVFVCRPCLGHLDRYLNGGWIKI